MALNSGSDSEGHRSRGLSAFFRERGFAILLGLCSVLVLFSDRFTRLVAAVRPADPIGTESKAIESRSPDEARPAEVRRSDRQVAFSSSATPLRLETPVALPGGGWRLGWNSIAGKEYRLQRLQWDDSPGFPSVVLWTEIGTITATGSVTFLNDLATDPEGSRFYRVVQMEPAVTEALGVGPLTADPSAPRSEGPVLLEVRVTGTAGIAEVRFLDGIMELGTGIRLESDRWRWVWPVTSALNGPHALTARAVSLGGLVRLSDPLNVTVSIAQARSRQSFQGLELSADRFETNGSVVVPSGNIRLGVVSFASVAVVAMNPSQGTLTGRGPVNLPTIGEVFDGDFEVDAGTGWLHAPASTGERALSAVPAPLVIALSPTTRLTPRRTEVQTRTGELRGEGVVEVPVPGSNGGVLRGDGVFDYDPLTYSVVVQGGIEWRGMRGTGTLSVGLGDASFRITGSLTVPIVGGGQTTLAHAILERVPGTGTVPEPAVTIAGDRSVNGATVAVAGLVDAAGVAVLQTDASTPSAIRDDPSRFVPLGADGSPLNGIGVRSSSAGVLGPFEYRPAGASLHGFGQHLYLRFSAGARRVSEGGENFLEFVQVTAGFGPLSALQFDPPLERLSGAVRRLQVGTLGVPELLEIFGPSRDDGLGVQVFSRLPLVWKGGTVLSDGVRGARFGMDSSGLGLTGLGGDFPDLVLDLSRRDGLRIPLSGEFKLPDGSGTLGSQGDGRDCWKRIA